ncbi:MAG TPA: hypothetical protein VFX84_03340 [Candidatus Saccharimonadales bacterium]|nr:hypothetical protein [Candidatus Saccharimonadales bacterium]
MTGAPAEPNCIDIAVPFRDELAARPDLPDVQIMGGIGSAALKHPETVILLDERRIVAPDDFLEDADARVGLHRFRPDGTLRDFDLLVKTADEEAVGEVEAIAERTVDGQLQISAFGLHSAEDLERQRENPLGFFAVRTFVSDRYVHEDGSMQKALFPFAVPLEREVLENWSLEVGGEEFQVANPASTILNYLTRSISGIRGVKDGPKVQEMASQIFGKEPELAEWCVDGPGQSQMDLAAILQTLRRSGSLPHSKRTLDVGGVLQIKAGSVRALADHEAFMIPDAEPNVRDAVLAWAVTKSRLLGYGESQEWAITLYQKYFERLFDGITKNNGDSMFTAS